MSLSTIYNAVVVWGTGDHSISQSGKKATGKYLKKVMRLMILL